MSPLYSVVAVVGAGAALWLALRLLGDVLAWWAEMTEGDDHE
jgi:hypothetical protein